MKNDEYFMNIALKEAAKTKGLTYPNPAVGAVIVHNGKIIGKGYHKAAGLSHAEVEAFNSLKTKLPKNAAMYVTLEPCSHFGKTPPCVDLIIKNKISEVIIASSDPNPLVNGKGIKKLKSAGITVKSGILKNKCDALNEDFFYSIKNKTPFVTIKCAMTLDGKIASATGDSKWITNEKSRAFGHYLRKINSIILTGINTVLKDNPEFNIRLYKNKYKQNCNIAIMDTELKFPLTAKLLTANKNREIIIFTKNDKLKSIKAKTLIKKNITVVGLKTDGRGLLNITEAMKYLYDNGFNSVLIEAGGKIIHSCLKNKLANKIHFMYAPKILGNGKCGVDGKLTDKISGCLNLKNIQLTKFDDNFMMTGLIKYAP